MYEQLKKTIIAKYAVKGKPIAEKSVDKYLSDIQKIKSIINHEGSDDDISFLYNFDDVSACIENMRGRKVINGEKVLASSNTKRNYYQSIVSVMDAIDDYTVLAKYQKVVNNYNKDYKVNLNKNNESLTTENEEKLISFEDLQKILSSIKLKTRDILDKYKQKLPLTDEDMNTYQTYTLLRLYMAFPARNEFGTLLWQARKTELDKTQNYVFLSTSMKKEKSILTINVYKTAGLYDTRIIPLDERVNLTGTLTQWRMLLRTYARQSDDVKPFKAGLPVFYPRFFDKDGVSWRSDGMTSNKLSKYFTRFFQKQIGKNISTTSIAKIVNSHENKQSADSLKKNSKARGTSVGTLSAVYCPTLPSSTLTSPTVI